MTFPNFLSPEIIGASLVIGSAAISGFYVSSIERAKQRKDARVAEIDKQLSKAQEAIERSYQFYEPALTRLLILQSTTTPQTVTAHWMPEIGKKIVEGLMNRISASGRPALSQDEFQDIEQTAIKAFLQGDAVAQQTLSKLSGDLIQDWANRHNSLAQEKIELQAQAEKLNQRAINSRFIAVTLQILGAIAVLADSVAS